MTREASQLHVSINNNRLKLTITEMVDEKQEQEIDIE